MSRTRKEPSFRRSRRMIRRASIWVVPRRPAAMRQPIGTAVEAPIRLHPGALEAQAREPYFLSFVRDELVAREQARLDELDALARPDDLDLAAQLGQRHRPDDLQRHPRDRESRLRVLHLHALEANAPLLGRPSRMREEELESLGVEALPLHDRIDRRFHLRA